MEKFELDIIIDQHAARIEGCDPCMISGPARKMIRADAKGMLDSELKFQTEDEIKELSNVILNWIKQYPSL